MSEFVKWSCGCIGLKPLCPPNRKAGGALMPKFDQAVLIKVCDDTEGSYCFLRRDMSGKTYEAIEPFQTEEYVKKIDQLIGRGYMFTDLASNIKYVVDSRS